jgi:hypothetical protein
MEKSITIASIAKALITFHVKVESVKKDATNPFFHSKYASLSNILETIQMPLNESGLSFAQFPSGENGLTTILMHAESGEFLQSDYFMPPVKNDPQGKGSAITYQRRYALASVLGLNIEEDDDANKASQPPATNKAAITTPQTNGSNTPPPNGATELPWLNENTKEFTGAVTKLKAGKSSIAALRKYFRISKATETKLTEQSKSA